MIGSCLFKCEIFRRRVLRGSNYVYITTDTFRLQRNPNDPVHILDHSKSLNKQDFFVNKE